MAWLLNGHVRMGFEGSLKGGARSADGEALLLTELGDC